MAYSPVERPEASYKIIYGLHDRVTPATELPSQYDGLFLEGDWGISKLDLGSSFQFEENDQYSEVSRDALAKGVRLYFGDFLANSNSFLITMGEFSVGGLMLLSLTKDLATKKKISRKDFLKMGIKGIGALWFWSYLSTLEYYSFRENQELSELEEKIVSFDDPLHPENPTFWFRNAVLARKLIAIGQMEQVRLDRRAVVPAVLGCGHTGIVEFLKRGEEACERVINLYPRWYPEAFFENFEALATITALDYNNAVGSWCVTDRYQVEGLGLLVNQEREVSGLRKEVI